MQYRHEVKHRINYEDMLVLQKRTRVIARPDPHAIGGKYFIRSLYFDNMYDKALRENLAGISEREKFRIRYYNGDTSEIHLEKKTKKAGLGYKQTANLSHEEVQRLLLGDYSWMPAKEDPLIQELYNKIIFECLRPKSIVDYSRQPYIFDAGNVRVTFDYDIRTTMHTEDFLDWNCTTIPVQDAACILEVKWDNYLPDIIRDAIQLKGRSQTAYSKYAASRMYD